MSETGCLLCVWKQLLGEHNTVTLKNVLKVSMCVHVSMTSKIRICLNQRVLDYNIVLKADKSISQQFQGLIVIWNENIVWIELPKVEDVHFFLFCIISN